MTRTKQYYIFTGILTACIFLSVFIAHSSADMLFGREYYEELKKHVGQAEKSIVVAMYFIIAEEGSPINDLVDELIKAKQRGVSVKVIIEDAKLGESLPAYNKLKENGINVSTDLPGKRLHVKGVVIDDRYVFLGSANWSRAAIEDNYEATLLVDSPEDARELTEFIEKASPKGEILKKYEGVSISTDFLLNPKKGSILLTTQADKQLDLYLLLLKRSQKEGKSSFKLNEIEGTNYDATRNLLNRLESNGFIDYKRGIATLKIDNEGEEIVIPYEYWEYGYDKKLSMRAKYLYLIALYEASRSVTYPYWFHSQKDMGKLYGIHPNTILKGLGELEREGIIEATRSKLIPPDFSARKANVYKMLPLKPLTN